MTCEDHLAKSGYSFIRIVRSSLLTPPSVEVPPDSLVCVVDDDASIRRSLDRLFRSWRIAVETFESARAYLKRGAHYGPSCVVLDVQMPGLDGLHLQSALADRDAQIVFITGHGDVPTCARAMKAGAVDFLTKPVGDEELLEAVARSLVRSVKSREIEASRAQARERFSDLTPREVEVMQRVIAGALNKQIADDIGVAEKTVKIHRGRVMAKLGVASVADLVRLAEAAGFTPIPIELPS